MNAHGTTHEEQLLFIRDGSFFEGLRMKSLLWTALLSLVTLLVLPNASFAQSVLTDDAHVNCSSGDDDDDSDKDGASTIHSGGASTTCGAKTRLI